MGPRCPDSAECRPLLIRPAAGSTVVPNSVIASLASQGVGLPGPKREREKKVSPYAPRGLRGEFRPGFSGDASNRYAMFGRLAGGGQEDRKGGSGVKKELSRCSFYFQSYWRL